MFWKKRRDQARAAASKVEQAVDDVAVRATDLAEQSLVIGWGGVALLVGAAAVGAAATYVVAQKRKNSGPKSKKAAETSGPSER